MLTKGQVVLGYVFKGTGFTGYLRPQEAAGTQLVIDNLRQAKGDRVMAAVVTERGHCRVLRESEVLRVLEAAAL